MGSTNANDEQPPHLVKLDAFWIMQTEVTHAQYARCVEDGACTPPNSQRWTDPAFANHPVVNVDWEQANAYAKWLGRRLPTEAEWEMAARGMDERIYPWGNEPPDETLANFNFIKGDTAPVGNYPDGASPFHAFDMAGNVEEWVADWYANDYYATSPAENPQGPESGIQRVVRGGSYNSNANGIRTTARGKALPNGDYPSVGFRIVAPAP